MADTLAEIYRNTLTDSSFDSNGEATIVTTNSSTSHVIKSIQAEDTDANIKLAATLKINDFDIIALTGNSTGTEIIAPSSTVKVKTSAVPFSYEDIDFTTRRSSTQYVSITQARINGYTAIPEIYVSDNNIGGSITANSSRDKFAFNIGPSNYHFWAGDNYGSTSLKRVYNNSGTEISTQSQSYTPAWWDGKRYAYYHGDSTNISGASGNGLNRIDVYTNTWTRIAATSINGPSSDPKMFGTMNSDFTLDRLFFWSEKNDNSGAQVYDAATSTVTALTNASPANTYGSGNTDNYGWYGIKRSNGKYRFVYPINNTTVRYYDWDIGTVHTSSVSFSSISLSGSSQNFSSPTNNHTVFNGKLFYLNQNNNLCAIDFDADTPSQSVISTNTNYTTYGSDVEIAVRTPTSTQINARSYNVTPSLKLRVTGITST